MNDASETTGVNRDSIDQTIINLIHGAFGTAGVGRDDLIEKVQSALHFGPLCTDKCPRQTTTKRDLSEPLSVRSRRPIESKRPSEIYRNLLRYCRDAE